MTNRIAGAAALAGVLALSAPASAEVFGVTFTELNDSGVSGGALLELSDDGRTLDVTVKATGLVPDQRHFQHIHGRFADGMVADSVTPTDADDADGDGFVEVGEGAVRYGPVLVSLLGGDGQFPLAENGSIDFSASYDLSDPAVFAGDFDRDDLLPLTAREIVLHGGFVPAGAGSGDSGEVQAGTSGYVPILPVAAGEISAVPLPAPAFLLLAGLGGLAFLRRRDGEA